MMMNFVFCCDGLILLNQINLPEVEDAKKRLAGLKS